MQVSCDSTHKPGKELILSVVLFVVLCVLAVLLIRLLIKPIGWALKLLGHALIGFAALFVLNFFGSIVGLELEMSWLNALIAGVFGLPGVILLILMKLFV